MGDLPPYDPDDEDDGYDGLSALDYSYSDGQTDPDSGFDALAGAFDTQDEDDDLQVPLFTVTNPPGTVTVTAYLDGRVQQIELSPKVIAMTEAELAEEIRVIADLAAQDARSAQYTAMLAGMREHGHDDVATRDFLTRDLALPSPEQANEVRVQVFSTRYGAEHG